MCTYIATESIYFKHYTFAASEIKGHLIVIRVHFHDCFLTHFKYTFKKCAIVMLY